MASKATLNYTVRGCEGKDCFSHCLRWWMQGANFLEKHSSSWYRIYIHSVGSEFFVVWLVLFGVFKKDFPTYPRLTSNFYNSPAFASHVLRFQSAAIIGIHPHTTVSFTWTDITRPWKQAKGTVGGTVALFKNFLEAFQDAEQNSQWLFYVLRTNCRGFARPRSFDDSVRKEPGLALQWYLQTQPLRQNSASVNAVAPQRTICSNNR